MKDNLLYFVMERGMVVPTNNGKSVQIPTDVWMAYAARSNAIYQALLGVRNTIGTMRDDEEWIPASDEHGDLSRDALKIIKDVLS